MLRGRPSAGTERSQYTMMSSTISLNNKGTRQNIAYLKVMDQIEHSLSKGKISDRT